MKANNVFEAAILNGTGNWIGHASLASSPDGGSFFMPSNKVQIQKFLDGLKIRVKGRYYETGVFYYATGLPKDFLAVLIDRVSLENVGVLGHLYGGFPKIFNYQPKHFNIHCQFRKGDYSSYTCDRFQIRFLYPYTKKSKSSCCVEFTRLPHDVESVAGWKVKIDFNINIVNSYFYKKNPEIFGN